ncbi:MAG: mechanosensitive ion channel family protein [Bacteroidales bacterium]|jgi:miniconductance mechanosensitive channel|nr:mechanosensitive ion channel family protein [Bacteroidales bacterium]
MAITDSLLVTHPGKEAIDTGITIMAKVSDALVAMGMSRSWADRTDNIIVLAIIILLALACNYIFRKVILKPASSLIKKTKARWDDIILNNRVMSALSHMVAPILIYAMLPAAFPDPQDIGVFTFLRKIAMILIIIAIMNFTNIFLTSVFDVFSQLRVNKGKPLKGLLQVLHIIVYFICTIIIISVILSRSPIGLLTGLGASAAILMLVFKDSILGFVSGIQLSYNHMLKVGDWISVPQHGADGNVIEVSLNTVKVRNWDNTITTLPPYMLVSDSFTNWEGMSKSGGRRIRRSVNIDMTSVCFCTPAMLENFKRIGLVNHYITTREKEIEEYNKKTGFDPDMPVNGRHMTNLGIFRSYLTSYIAQLPALKKDMTFMVRQLQPTEKGIPIEIYFFSSVTDWVDYENIQSDVFDHILAIIPQFELRVFQNPTGKDVEKIGAIRTGNNN